MSSKAQLVDHLGGLPYVKIPFEYKSDFIIIKVKLNGTLPLNFLFDTGAEHSLIFKKTFTDLLSIPYGRKIKVYGSDMAVPLYAYVTRNIRFDIPPIEAKMDVLVMERDFFELDELTGFSIDGILGAHFFKNYVIKIDYRRQIITMYHPQFPPPHGKKFIPYPLTVESNKPYIHAITHFNSADSANMLLLLDTGAGLSLLLHTDSHEDIKLPERLLSLNIGTGLGGHIRGYVGRVAQLNVFDASMPNVVTNFQELGETVINGDNFKRNGIIGNRILSRFTIIIDYPGEILYLKPRRTIKKEIDFDKSGISLAASGAMLNHYYVVDVIQDSPAARVGIRNGDRIVRCNGLPSSFYSMEALLNKFRSKAGKRIKLTIERDGEKIKKEFSLEDLF
jgi:hypothetical protein